jgi:hypothetical protein
MRVEPDIRRSTPSLNISPVAARADMSGVRLPGMSASSSSQSSKAWTGSTGAQSDAWDRADADLVLTRVDLLSCSTIVSHCSGSVTNMWQYLPAACLCSHWSHVVFFFQLYAELLVWDEVLEGSGATGCPAGMGAPDRARAEAPDPILRASIHHTI